MTRRVIAYLTCAVLACVTLTPTARAARFYLGGDLGWTLLLGNDELDDDLVYGGALGIDFGGPAVEITAKYASFDGNEVSLPIVGTTGGDLDVLSLGVSARYNIDMSPIRLYVLVGGAYHVVDFQTFDSIPQAEKLIQNDQNEFGLILGGGLEIELGDHVTVGPDLRYNLVFSDSFDSVPQIKDTDLTDYPDFLQITARANLYF